MRCQKILLLLVIAILATGCVAPGVYQTGDVVTYNPDARIATIVLDERGDEFLTASIYSDSLDRWRVVDAGTKKWLSKSSVYRLYDHKIDHVNIDDLWAI